MASGNQLGQRIPIGLGIRNWVKEGCNDPLKKEEKKRMFMF
jgi:hypothetical protein